MDYKPSEIEANCIKQWEETQLYKTDDHSDKPTYYVLEMFPYPSGKLHMGHVRNYSIGDCVARFKRMKGFNVLYPMGYDSFGLPAENAAVQRQVDPKEWTLENIEVMKAQQIQLGLSYDWNRELATCKEDYYHWNQWIFKKMVEKGLVYRKKAFVNWDPVDQTVLANEQVIDGKGWRSGALVEQRDIEQWYIKITDYADELLSGLDQLDGWPDRVKAMQKNWIGRSEGTTIQFDIVDDQGQSQGSVDVFTTRPDTLMGVTYVVLAAEHPFVSSMKQQLNNSDALDEFVKDVVSQSTIDRSADDAEKKGFITGWTAIHPVTNERVPLVLGNYVLMDYGTGAVMAVPAHDQRDFEFAKQYDFPIKRVIEDAQTPSDDPMEAAYEGPGILIHSDSFDGLSNDDAKKVITTWLSDHDKGQSTVTYRLRDWLISRQRCWGTPIPMAFDDQNQAVTVEDLPVSLPSDLVFDGKGNPLERSQSFKDVTQNGTTYQRETDTMDTFFDSSWYFFRYCDAQNTQAPFDPSLVNKWLPVDQYIGGIEHAVLHLLYARFFTKVLRDLGMVDVDEPFKQLLCQGMVLKDGAKMSKSLGNTVDPGSIIDQYGADTARLFILFGAPVERDLEWSDDGVDGSFRFIKRVYKLCSEYTSFSLDESKQKELTQMIHKTVKRVTQDVERFQFNTAISAVMEFVNWQYQHGSSREAIHVLCRLLAPFIPFAMESIWSQLGETGSIHSSEWPTYDDSLTQADEVTFVLQVNGKVRDKLQVPRDIAQEAAQELALSQENIQKFTAQGTIKKVIFVPNKLMNFVVQPA